MNAIKNESRNIKYIVISVDNFEQGRFFLRWQTPLNAMGYNIIFVTYTYSMYRYVKDNISNENNVDFIYKQNDNFDFATIKDKICLSIEYKAKWNSLKELGRLYYAVLEKYNSKYNQLDIKYIVLWNGSKIADISWRDIATDNKIKTIYIEIANMKGKIFVDPIGTNAKSYLYKNTNVLMNYDYSEEEFCLWKDKYIIDKFKQNTVKQAKKRAFIKAVKANLLDLYGVYFKKAAYVKHLDKKKILDRFHTRNFSYTHLPNDCKYIFFPLQVTTDTQILLNGNMSLLDSVRYAIRKAKDEGCYLVIKPHPAEKNPKNIDEIISVSNSYDKCIFTNKNTFELLRDAYKVITINSTVGIEAMILGCNVDIIGRSFYEFFKNDDLQRYIMGYLVNVDFWEEDDLTISQAGEILSRGDIFDK